MKVTLIPEFLKGVKPEEITTNFVKLRASQEDLDLAPKTTRKIKSDSQFFDLSRCESPEDLHEMVKLLVSFVEELHIGLDLVEDPQLEWSYGVESSCAVLYKFYVLEETDPIEFLKEHWRKQLQNYITTQQELKALKVLQEKYGTITAI